MRVKSNLDFGKSDRFGSGSPELDCCIISGDAWLEKELGAAGHGSDFEYLSTLNHDVAKVEDYTHNGEKDAEL